MDIDWPDVLAIDLLTAISECGSVSAAATLVGMAQPNASRLLSRIEADLAVRLVERHPRGSILTADGERVVEWGKPLIAASRAFTAKLATLAAGEPGDLSVASSMTIAEHLLPVPLSTLHHEQPQARIALAVHNSRDVFRLVTHGETDLGFVETPDLPRGTSRRVIGTDRLVTVVAPSHPLSMRQTALSVEEIARTPLIVREAGSGTRRTLDAALESYRPAQPLLELGSNAAVLAGVLSGAGPAVLSELIVGPHLVAGTLSEVRVTWRLPLRRRLHAIWNAEHAPNGTARRLIDLVMADPRTAVTADIVTPPALLR